VVVIASPGTDPKQRSGGGGTIFSQHKYNYNIILYLSQNLKMLS